MLLRSSVTSGLRSQISSDTFSAPNAAPHIMPLVCEQLLYLVVGLIGPGQQAKRAYRAAIAAATPRRRAETEATMEAAPPVKGVTDEEPEPEPEGAAAPDAVPDGALVVEAVG